MNIQECIIAAKKLPIEDLLKKAIKNTETDKWIYLTLVISDSDHEPDLVLQDADSLDKTIDHSYGAAHLAIRDLLSNKWEIEELK